MENFMRSLRSFLFIASLVVFAPAAVLAEQAAPDAKAPAAAQVEAAKCEHGVKASICARCNPKLEAVYKAKGDWCAEHSRPESQCVLCNPELAAKGIK
jgi:hypothetical protein